MSLRHVVLPEPDGPSMAKNSPGWISRSTASTARTLRKWRETCWKATAGVISVRAFLREKEAPSPRHASHATPPPAGGEDMRHRRPARPFAHDGRDGSAGEAWPGGR